MRSEIYLKKTTIQTNTPSNGVVKKIVVQLEARHNVSIFSANTYTVQRGNRRMESRHGVR